MTSWQRTLWGISIAETLTIIGFNMRTPFLPFYVAELGASNLSQQLLWAGIISAAGAALMTVAAPFWGAISDRYGRKPMVLRAMVAGWLTISLMALVTTTWQLLGLRVLEGALTGTTTAAIALVATTVPKERLGFSLGLIQTGIFSGSAIGPLVGGVIADQIGHRATFVIAGTLLLLSALIVLFTVHEHFERPVRVAASSGAAGGSMVALLMGRAMLAMILVMLVLRAASGAVQPIVPLFVERLGSSESAAATLSGLTIGVVGLTSAISAVIFGRLADRIGHRPILIVAALFSGLLYLPQAAAQSVAQLVLFSGLFGIAAGGVLPTANAVVAELTPAERRGAVYGFAAAATSLGAFIGPLGGAALAAAVSIRATFVITGLLMLAVAGWVWWAVPAIGQRPELAEGEAAVVPGHSSRS